MEPSSADLRRRAIFLTASHPFPADTHARHRESHLIRILGARFDVELACFDSRSNAFDLDGLPTHRVIQRDRGRVRQAIEGLQPDIVHGFSRPMVRLLKERFSPGALLWVSSLAMAHYIPIARRFGYRVVLDEQGCESDALFDGAFSRLSALPGVFKAAQCAYHEIRFCNEADMIVLPSELDLSRLSKLVPSARTLVIPSSIECSRYAEMRGQPGSTLYFNGRLDWAPNEEGLLWFIEEILPRMRRRLQRQLPRIVIAGAPGTGATARLKHKLQHTGIELKLRPDGGDDSLMRELGEAAALFMPIRSGRGGVHRILEAMAAGRAIVTTGRGVEGLVISPGYDVLVADQEDAFASAICRVFTEPRLREELGAHAAQTAASRYDWALAGEKIHALVDRLPSDATPGDRRARSQATAWIDVGTSMLSLIHRRRRSP